MKTGIKYIIILFIFTSCSNRNKTIPKDNYSHIFITENLESYAQDLNDNDRVIKDTVLAFKLHKILDSNNSFERYLYDFVYYLPMENNLQYDIVVRTDESSIREYIVLNNYRDVNKCIEITASYADEPYSYDRYSIIRNDSLITYTITQSYYVKQETELEIEVYPKKDTIIDVISPFK